jgi:hypothetical protein
MDLSHSLVLGSHLKFELQVESNVTKTMLGSAATHATIPLLKFELDTATVDKNADGDFKVSATLAKVRIVPKDAHQENAARRIGPRIGPMTGLVMTYWVSAEGYVRDVHVQLPPSSPTELQQALGNVKDFINSSVLFPSRKLGLGATWQVCKRSSGSEKLDTLVVTNYVLKTTEARHPTVEFTSVRYAVGNSFGETDMPPDTTLLLTSFNASSKGVVHLDLDGALIDSSTEARTAVDVVFTSGMSKGSGSIVFEGKLTNSRLSELPPKNPEEARREGKVRLGRVIEFLGGEKSLGEVKAWRFNVIVRGDKNDKEWMNVRQNPGMIYISDGEQVRVATPSFGFFRTAQGDIVDMEPSIREEMLQGFKSSMFSIVQRANDPKYTFIASGSEIIGDVETLVIDIDADGTSVRWYVDPKDGRIVRATRMVYGGTVEKVYEYSNWKKVDGVQFPCRTTELGAVPVISETTEVEINPPLNSDLFAKPQQSGASETKGRPNADSTR